MPIFIAIVFLVVLVASLAGWLEGVPVLDIAMSVFSLVGLVGIIRYPWDLYMEARGVLWDQRDSAAADIPIAHDDRQVARRLARRLLALCVTVHVATALIIAAITFFSGGELGYWFAASFLLATFIRPAATLYRHVRARLKALRGRARYPREDVLELRERVAELERRNRALEAELGETTKRNDTALESLGESVRQQQARVTRDVGRLDDKLDRMLQDVERLFDRRTEDVELLAGLRALLRMVRQS